MATHAGAELDLLVMGDTRRFGFAFKRTAVPCITRPMRVAITDCELERLDVAYVGDETFRLRNTMRAGGLHRVLDGLEPLTVD